MLTFFSFVRCKANVVGRTCNRCKAGYWAFPHCQLCNCDLRGSSEDICDEDSARCHCKVRVFKDFLLFYIAPVSFGDRDYYIPILVLLNNEDYNYPIFLITKNIQRDTMVIFKYSSAIGFMELKPQQFSGLS